ncbi:DUF4012 domain-containing protein [Nocardioides sp.]|uniref:DUF4012 domain-containing protein n=1 Tax=Nocardioides sp. TaxID=35761 RepID=UPI0037845D90
MALSSSHSRNRSRKRRRRTVLAACGVAVGLALCYTAWLTWQVQGELRGAEASATKLKAAWRSGDVHAQEQAAAQLTDDAAAAQAHTSGPWWHALGHLPFVGDDVEGIAALSSSLHVIAHDAVIPLNNTVDSLDGLVTDGRVDLDTVASLQQPVEDAYGALVIADDQLAGHDSSGYVTPLRTRFDRYVELVHGLRTGLDGASKAVSVLPTMAGADGPTNYLLIFQNNAEIRATGGMPGSWALLHADDGKIEMKQQGSVKDFPLADSPVLPLSNEETAVYGQELGLYFQDPGWTFDFPRAAELWRAHWDRQFPSTSIDGVVAIDPVAMSYLLEGTGPVRVGDVTLTSANAVEELLNRPYIEAGPAAQNAFFEEAAKAIFDKVTGSLQSPVRFVQGLNRSAEEGRLLVSSFDDEVSASLVGTGVEGAMPRDDGRTPYVDVGLNDLTGSKMSYYLRYRGDVTSDRCERDVQHLTGTLTMRQLISPAEAARLPTSVTGGGNFGTQPGDQYVMVRIYGPYDGTIERVRLNGKTLPGAVSQPLNGRPVVSIDVLVTSRDELTLTWSGTSGPGQTGDGQLRMTPSVVPGSGRQTFASSC